VNLIGCGTVCADYLLPDFEAVARLLVVGFPLAARFFFGDCFVGFGFASPADAELKP
jgi:hypothetical protein